MEELTLSIIKPGCVARNQIGAINAVIANNGLRIVAVKMVQLSSKEAEDFYAVHSQRPFFQELVDYMISGPVLLQVLAGDGAVDKYRNLMGATNPADAAPGTLRKLFATSISDNAVHGSDSRENAEREISYFFSNSEIFADAVEP